MTGALILAFIICVIALVATLKVGFSDPDEEYTPEKSIGNLMKMYGYLFPVIIVVVIIYWAFF